MSGVKTRVFVFCVYFVSHSSLSLSPPPVCNGDVVLKTADDIARWSDCATITGSLQIFVRHHTSDMRTLKGNTRGVTMKGVSRRIYVCACVSRIRRRSNRSKRSLHCARSRRIYTFGSPDNSTSQLRPATPTSYRTPHPPFILLFLLLAQCRPRLPGWLLFPDSYRW